MQKTFRTPCMIADGSFAGSLAAVRVLGRSGIPVSVCRRGSLDAALWSRHTKAHRRVCTERGSSEFLSDVNALTKGSCKDVLLATSDMTAWLYARHKDELGERFIVYTPSFSVIDTILDKAKLWSACQKIGIPTLESWFPQTGDEIVSIKNELPYPLVLKPRSHVHGEFFTKGIVIGNPEELSAQFAKFTEKASIGFDGSKCLTRSVPMLQRFVADAVENVVSVSGFIDRSGRRSVVRASRKVLQRSRPIGLGLAFESIEVDPTLAKAALELCREVGYFGIFEIEFIERAGVWCLIDFNPRFYQEMGLDIAAGALLPLYAYLDACGDEAALEDAIARNLDAPAPALRFADTFGLLLRFVAKPVSEIRALDWLVRSKGRLVDTTFEAKDPLPAVANAVAEIAHVVGKLVSAVTPRRPKFESSVSRDRHQAGVASGGCGVHR